MSAVTVILVILSLRFLTSILPLTIPAWVVQGRHVPHQSLGHTDHADRCRTYRHHSVVFIGQIRHLGQATAFFNVGDFVTLFSPFILGEKVGVYRGCAVIAGLIGIYMITDPFSGEFNIGAVYGSARHLPVLCWSLCCVCSGGRKNLFRWLSGNYCRCHHLSPHCDLHRPWHRDHHCCRDLSADACRLRHRSDIRSDWLTSAYRYGEPWCSCPSDIFLSHRPARWAGSSGRNRSTSSRSAWCLSSPPVLSSLSGNTFPAAGRQRDQEKISIATGSIGSPIPPC